MPQNESNDGGREAEEDDVEEFSGEEVGIVKPAANPCSESYEMGVGGIEFHLAGSVRRPAVKGIGHEVCEPSGNLDDGQQENMETRVVADEVVVEDGVSEPLKGLGEAKFGQHFRHFDVVERVSVGGFVGAGLDVGHGEAAEHESDPEFVMAEPLGGKRS